MPPATAARAVAGPASPERSGSSHAMAATFPGTGRLAHAQLAQRLSRAGSGSPTLSPRLSLTEAEAQLQHQGRQRSPGQPASRQPAPAAPASDAERGATPPGRAGGSRLPLPPDADAAALRSRSLPDASSLTGAYAIATSRFTSHGSSAASASESRRATREPAAPEHSASPVPSAAAVALQQQLAGSRSLRSLGGAASPAAPGRASASSGLLPPSLPPRTPLGSTVVNSGGGAGSLARARSDAPPAIQQRNSASVDLGPAGENVAGTHLPPPPLPAH